MGAAPNPANSEALAAIQQGVSAWNNWRKDKDVSSLNLSGADLHGRDLTGADLRAVDLSNANLRGATLGQGTLLWNANLSNTDLYQTNLRGADMQDVNFSNADLYQADLRESNLQGADLSTVKGGLLSRQLAGSDLTGAKLPEPLAKLYDSLSSVKEISDSAQKLFLALLAGCLYSWLTIAQTSDVELITNRATTPLPIIQAAIPIVGFYVVAPLILLCLYFYFHFYLQKLWEELGSLPAVFTDGRELHKRTDPWLLNDLVRSHFVKLKDGRPFLSYFQSWISVVLAWWLVPITLFAFWLRYIHRHDLFWTMVHALLLALAIFSAVRLYRIANSTLRGGERQGFRFKGMLKDWRTYARFASITALGFLLVAASLDEIRAEKYVLTRDSILIMPFNTNDPHTWISWCLKQIGFYPFANLRNADISLKPPGWTGKKDEELDLVKGASLEGADLRYADATQAFFVKAGLAGVNLEHAAILEADLRQSNLLRANMESADLILADLRQADLTSANLKNAEMYGAFLQDARLESAALQKTFLRGAHLDRARVSGAGLEEADLELASLEKANLPLAVLKKADLRSANLQGANLEGTDLSDADLRGAGIKYADFRSVPGFNPTRGLTRTMIVEAKDWQLAFYDADMLKQLGLPPDHNEKLQKQMEAGLKQTKSAATPPAKPK